MPKIIKAKKTCCLAYEPEGFHKPKSALYSCVCGADLILQLYSLARSHIHA